MILPNLTNFVAVVATYHDEIRAGYWSFTLISVLYCAVMSGLIQKDVLCLKYLVSTSTDYRRRPTCIQYHLDAARSVRNGALIVTLRHPLRHIPVTPQSRKYRRAPPVIAYSAGTKLMVGQEPPEFQHPSASASAI